MYCKKCNSLLNEDNICSVCESDIVLKKTNELSQVIEELKGGNQEAFNTFYNYTYKYVYSRAKMLSSDEQTANDVMQEVYISAYKNINSLKSNDSVFAWLRTITFNASNRIMKKNTNELVLSEENEEMLEALPDENEQTEEAYINKQDIEIIHACINRLSDEQRIVLLAYYYDNLKVEEIAELLQISSGTVKSRLFTARKNLKRLIEEEENKNGYKLHSFSGLSLALALRKLLQDNIDNFVIDNDTLYRSICKKLNSPLNASSANNIVKPKSKFLNAISSNLKNKIDYKIAEVGVKKFVLSTIATVIATGVIGGTVAVVTSNLSNKPTNNDLSVDASVVEPSSEEIVLSEEISSDEADSETGSEVDSSQTFTPSNTESGSTPTTSTSQNATTAIEANSDCVSNTTPYKTVTLNKKTTYYGYVGYFTLNGYVDDVDLPFYNLGTESNPKALYSTEYYCIEFDKPIYFACDKSKVKQQDFMKYVNQVGQGKTRVSIFTSDCISSTTPYKTITLNKKTTYYGYPGYFTNYWDAPITLVELGLSDSNEGHAICPTEYKDIESGNNVFFIYDSQKYGPPNGFIVNVDDNGGRAQIPAKITNIRMDAFEYFDQPINEYLYWTCYDGLKGEETNTVKIYTTMKDDEKYGNEIYSKFEQYYGYSTNEPLNTNSYGRYYIDDSGKPYNIYHYMLSAPTKN